MLLQCWSGTVPGPLPHLPTACPRPCKLALRYCWASLFANDFVIMLRDPCSVRLIAKVRIAVGVVATILAPWGGELNHGAGKTAVTIALQGIGILHCLAGLVRRRLLHA